MFTGNASRGFYCPVNKRRKNIIVCMLRLGTGSTVIFYLQWHAPFLQFQMKWKKPSSCFLFFMASSCSDSNCLKMAGCNKKACLNGRVIGHSVSQSPVNLQWVIYISRIDTSFNPCECVMYSMSISPNPKKNIHMLTMGQFVWNQSMKRRLHVVDSTLAVCMYDAFNKMQHDCSNCLHLCTQNVLFPLCSCNSCKLKTARRPGCTCIL